MESLTVRISKSSHATLRALADKSNQSMTQANSGATHFDGIDLGIA
jgi:hypothetical protein